MCVHFSGCESRRWATSSRTHPYMSKPSRLYVNGHQHLIARFVGWGNRWTASRPGPSISVRTERCAENLELRLRSTQTCWWSQTHYYCYDDVMAKIFSQSVQKKRMPLIGFGDLMGDNYVSKKMKTNLCVFAGKTNDNKKSTFQTFPSFFLLNWLLLDRPAMSVS